MREAPTDKAEAEYVVHQVERLVGGTGMFSHDSGRAESHARAERSFGDIGGRKGNIDEERRLFYVGMSRARDHLYLVRARRRILMGQRHENPPSRFLTDIEDALKGYDRASTGRRRRAMKSDDGVEQLNLFG